MKDKKRIVLGTIVILALSTLYHGIYDKFPSFITSILFPTNESIWEHNKMILLAFITWTVIEKLLDKKDENIIFKNFMATILCIILVLAFFTPVYFYILKTKDNIVITIIIYTIAIFTSLLASSFVRLKKSKDLEILSSIGFIALGITFGILTFYHPDVSIFKEF